MFRFSTLLVALAAAAVSVRAAPIHKRIQQDTPSAGLPFEQACDAAGGGQQCNAIKVSAIATLLAAAGPCDQQDAADQMIDFAKQSLKSDKATIAAAVTFSQQPRNSPSSEKVPYCNKAPKNAELQGAFQCQFQGTKDTFVGGLQPGAAGTVPFGQTAPVSPPGSCPLNPGGPIPDGQQLSDVLKSGGGGGGGGSAAPASIAGGDAAASAGSAAPTSTSAAPTSTPTAPAADTSTAAAPASTTGSDSGSGNFHPQNGKAAQALNDSFKSLTADSPCTAGQNACIAGDFAQCVGGQFVTTPCGSGLQCSALPLVNSAGTSITCTTAADTQTRIQNALGSSN